MKLPSLVLFFLLAYLISWIIWLPLYLPHFGIENLPTLPYHHALGAIGPLCAAFIMTFKEKGLKGIKCLVCKIARWHVPIHIYVIAFLSPFIMLIVGVYIYNHNASSPVQLQQMWLNKEFPAFSFISFFLYNLFTFGFGEETGWRGYSLPKLQEKMHPLLATLLLTVLWAGWHIPLFFYRQGYVGMDFFGIIGWIMSLLTGAILLTWLFNSSNQSILIVSIFHATIDITFTSEASLVEIAQIQGILITVLGIVVLVGTKFRLGLAKRRKENIL
jgi:uncharacterized protein